MSEWDAYYEAIAGSASLSAGGTLGAHDEERQPRAVRDDKDVRRGVTSTEHSAQLVVLMLGHGADSYGCRCSR